MKAITPDKWEWYGYPAHFICANDCRFRLATKVGKYIVSTVGDLHYSRERGRQPLGVSPDSFFETFVFHAGSVCAEKGCECGETRIGDAMEIEGIRTATAGEARKMHMKTCRKYARQP